MKENKGITLVALIITIIVLLILAVVTISAVNEGSLFAHANNATEAYSKSAEEENTLISGYIGKIEEYAGEQNSDRILELMIAALNGDEEANNEMNLIFQSNKDNIYIFAYDNDYYNPVYVINGVYYKIDMQNQKAEILTDKNYPTLYAEVLKFEQDLDNIKLLFIGKNVEDFDQERIGENEWKLYNLEGIFAEEFEFRYSGEYMYFTYDSSQELGKVMLYLENDEVIDDKLTGKIVGFEQDD